MKTITRYFAIAAILSMAMYGTAFGQPPETEPPTVPTGLSVIEIHNEALGISWNASTDNTGVHSYGIYVNGIRDGYSMDTEYIITSLSPNTSYNITVSAFDVYANESGQTVHIVGTTTTSGISGRVYDNGVPLPGVNVLLTRGSTTYTSLTDINGNYYFGDLLTETHILQIGVVGYEIEVSEDHTTIQDFRLNEGLPVVHTYEVTSISGTGALCGGQVTGTGIEDKGVVWSTTPNITALSPDTVSSGPGDGDFSCDMNAYLTPNTTYYIKAWARNSNGIGFGQERCFYTGCNPMILNELFTYPSSCGASDGSISISHDEQAGPYTYAWTGPNGFSASAAGISGIEAGTYEITVTDKNGCETVKTYEITDPPSPAINNLAETICDDGSFAITPVNGTDGFVPPGTTYTWGMPVVTGGLTGGAAGVEQASINGTLNNPTSTAQTATYTVTPESGTCTGATFTVTVTVDPAPAINNLSISACEGTEFSVTPVNGTDGSIPAGTTYSWGAPVVTGGLTGGEAAVGQASIHGTLLNPTTSAQTATYTVTPLSGGCTGAPFTVTVTIHTIPAITGESLTHISCYDCTDGAIAINASGGSPPYDYAWIGPEGFSSTDEDITGLAQGLYTATLMDQNMCTAAEQFEVGFPLTVTKTSDYDPIEDGPEIGTLRYAMVYANSNPGLDSIVFAIPGNGPHTIFPETALPLIEESLIIDGYTQAGALPASTNSSSTILIEIDGSLESNSSNTGFVLTGGSSTIRGLMINGFDHYGIHISASGGNVIEGNHIGVDMVGDQLSANYRGCINIVNSNNNLIGGDDPAQRNVLAGIEGPSDEEHSLITLQGPQTELNVVKGNYIGLNAGGTTGLGSCEFGISIYNEAHHNTIGPDNVISGRPAGGINFPSGNTNNTSIIGNFIGTNFNGTGAIPNSVGIRMRNSANNTIGGPLLPDGTLGPEGNIISGNSSDGIYIYGESSTENVIMGNYIGLGSDGSDEYGNGRDGIHLNDATNNLIGGILPVARNSIAGNTRAGVWIETGPEASAGNKVQGNYIGLGSNGGDIRGNEYAGVRIDGPFNTIGGTEPGAGNVISGNEVYGIQISNNYSVENVIQGNIIGLDHTGTESTNSDGVPITERGIELDLCMNNHIGGAEKNARNIISDNRVGIEIVGSDESPFSSNHIIIGNFIGTDITGKISLGNRNDGIRVSYANDNVIGGSTYMERNIISGNGGSGIQLGRSDYNQIYGNYIGTDSSGKEKIENYFGIYLEGSESNTIGGPESGMGNLISGNNVGIWVNADGDFRSEANTIQGNIIGTDIVGKESIGNVTGIRFGDYSDNNLVGGSGSYEGNLIAFNHSGIVSNGTFHPSEFNSFLSNSIHSNTSIGINLYGSEGDIVTVNDPLDTDEGANGLQNFPLLDTVTFTQDEVMVAGSLYSVPGQDFLLQFFVSPKADETGYGEGKTFIGSDTVTCDDSGYTNFHLTYPTSLRDGLVVTATATDMDGNTSEFSNAVGGAQDQQASDVNMPMHWVIHEEGIPYISDSSDFLALHRAFDAWEAIPSSEVDFEYDGPTTQEKAVANDGINLITFMDESYFTTNEVLGLAAKTLMMNDASGTAEIVDADIVFNPYFVQSGEGFSTDTHTGQYDLQSIATHEIGHTFGMIHSGVLESTMFFSVLENTADKRTLEEDDIAWASYRYPKNPAFGTTYGFIKGNITYGDDPLLPVVGGALVIARNTSTGDEIHSYSDENGNYVIPVPAGTYTVAIEPLDGNVHGYYLTQANISYYIDGITIYTDFPNEFYNGGEEGPLDDNPDESVPVTVIVADTTHNIDLVTNKDVTPPYIMAVSPKRDSVGASVMTQVFMGFSEQVDINTFTDETCFLTWDDDGVEVEVYGNFVIADNYGRRIGFTPKEYPLEYSTEYTLHMTSGITDLKDNGLTVPADPYSFTTEDADLIPPRVTDMLPDPGNDTVFTNANIMVFFSEAMDAATTPDGFSVTYNEGQMIQGMYSWSQDLKILTFNPDSFLDEGTEYKVSVTAGLKDLSQNPLAEDSVWIFSTVPQAPPSILYVGPEPDQDSVSLDSPLLIDFSEPIDPQTINPNTVQLLLNNTPVTGTFEFVYSNSRVVFRPDQLLQPETTYDVLVTDQISDVSDPPLLLEEGVSHQFVTADAVEDPYIGSLDPSSGVTGTMVTIAGRGIDPNPDHVKVMFGNTEASIIYNESTFLTTRVPPGATEGMVTMEVNGTLSNEEYFYVPPFNELPGDEIRRTVGTQAQAEDVETEPDAAYAYITNSGADAITRLNMVTFQTQSLAVGDMPVQIDIHPNGDMAYVSNHLSHDVSVINLDLMQVVETIAVGINPYGLVVSPTGDLLFVANTTSQDVIYIDVDPYSGGYDKVVRSVSTHASNTGIDASPDAGLVLIACDQGILFLITDEDDPAFNTINRTVKTSGSASGVEILPDAGLAVAFTEDNYLEVIGIVPGVNYAKIVGRVNTRGSIGDIDISPDGQIIYVTHPLTSEVSVYQIEYTGAPNADASVNVSVNLELINVIEVDDMPYAVAVDPRGERVFVGHYTQDGQVTEIDVSGSIDAILFLEELIESVMDAIGDGIVNTKYGDKLLVDLDKTLSRYNSGQLESAIDHLDNFIIRVDRWIQSGDIPEGLGNDWLEAAYRIREQLVADLLEQESLLKGTGGKGSDTRSIADGLINDNQDLPGEQALKLQNQPNPFSQQTRINFEIPEIDRSSIPVVMRVFNTNGQVVRTLVHMDMEPGRYSVNWSGSLDDGGQVPDGIYLLELRIPGQRETLTISIIR